MKIQELGQRPCTSQVRSRLMINEGYPSRISVPSAERMGKLWTFQRGDITLTNAPLPIIWPAVCLIPVVCSCVLVYRVASYWTNFRFSPVLFSVSLFIFQDPALSLSSVKATPVPKAELDDLASPSSLTKLLFFCFGTCCVD